MTTLDTPPPRTQLSGVPDDLYTSPDPVISYTCITCAHCGESSPWEQVDPYTGIRADGGDWHAAHAHTHGHTRFQLYTVIRASIQVHREAE